MQEFFSEDYDTNGDVIVRLRMPFPWVVHNIGQSSETMIVTEDLFLRAADYARQSMRKEKKEQISKLKTRKLCRNSNKEGECAICLVEYAQNRILKIMPCEHEFHKTCLDRWLIRQLRCPLCRFELIPRP